MFERKSSRARAHRGNELHALILAGGFGRRLEPLVLRLRGEAIPKQFCDFGCGRSLLQQTIDRIAPLLPSKRITVVVDHTQLHRARAQLDSRYDVELVDQPCDQGTAAGVLLPLLHVLRRDGDATVVLLPSDHGIARDGEFLATVAAARDAVGRSPEAIVLLGVVPDAPNTDYGWIVHDGPTKPLLVPVRVTRFLEKPEPRRANALFRSGRALWSTMILVARATTLVEWCKRRVGPLVSSLESVVARSVGATALQTYRAVPRADFSSDVLGDCSGLSVLAFPRATGWSDLGTEQRLMKWMHRHPDRWGNIRIDDCGPVRTAPGSVPRWTSWGDPS